MKSIKKIVIMLVISLFMISMAIATVNAVDVSKADKKTDFKEKKIISYKITWNCNEGTISGKKTVINNVKKGATVKIPKTPKRNGYTFLGWYSKKSGGKEITKNSKPTKKATFYAKWVKNLNAAEKQITGLWTGKENGYEYSDILNDFDYSQLKTSFYRSIKLNNDRTFTEIISVTHHIPKPASTYNKMYKGTWSASGGKITLNVKKSSQGSDKNMKKWSLVSPFSSYKDSNIYNLSSDRKTISTNSTIEKYIYTLTKK